MTHYLEFEKPLAEIEGKAEELRALARQNEEMDIEDEAQALDAKAEALFKWYQENADRDGINSTPTFLIDGQKYSNMAYDEFAEVLDGKLG